MLFYASVRIQREDKWRVKLVRNLHILQSKLQPRFAKSKSSYLKERWALFSKRFLLSFHQCHEMSEKNEGWTWYKDVQFHIPYFCWWLVALQKIISWNSNVMMTFSQSKYSANTCIMWNNQKSAAEVVRKCSGVGV